MNDLSDLLGSRAVVTGLRANAKKTLLQLLAAKIANANGLDDRRVFETLLERERLGSTGFGGGVAIPHGKLAGLPRVTGLLAKLETPIEFGALDSQPVDLVFVLLAPEGAGADHLKALARVSRAFRDRALVEKIRGSTSADAIYAMLAPEQRSQAA
jgi:PTS system nitrogen regulatory IIA component